MIKNLFTMLWWNEPGVIVPENNELCLGVCAFDDEIFGKTYTFDVCRYDANVNEFYITGKECDEYLENVCAWASLTRDNYLIKKLQEGKK